MRSDQLKSRLEAVEGFDEVLRDELPYRDVALAIAGLRADHELSQAEFGGRVGMHQSVIARIESGRHALNARQLNRIAHAFGLSWRPVFESMTATPSPQTFQEPAAVEAWFVNSYVGKTKFVEPASDTFLVRYLGSEGGEIDPSYQLIRTREGAIVPLARTRRSGTTSSLRPVPRWVPVAG